MEIGNVGRIVQSPIDPSLLIFIGTKDVSWIIENCGEKITANILGRPISEWIFHPTERNWALVSADSICDDYSEKEPCRIVRELYVTQTLGNDWKLLGDYVQQFSWGVGNLEHIKMGIPKERILLTYLPGGRGNQKKTKNYSYKYDFVYSDNFFKSKFVGVRKGSKFFIKNDILYVAQVEDQESQIINLLRASLTQKKYVFEPIVTNQKNLKNHSFKFLDSSGSGIFLYINNFGKKINFGNVYSSDIEGKEFALSLKNNIQIFENDFEAIMGVNGLYLANVISGKYIKLYKQELLSSLQENSIGKETTKEIKTKKNSQLKYSNYAKTVITHNQGGDWKRLKAPERDSKGNSYNCSDHCNLHLYSYSSNKPRFYTIDNAVGLIIGNGNVGRYLDFTYQNVALFLSRDGGNNWYEIKKGTYVYEIGDHGGLIVIAQYNTKTKYISYTYDEGITWDELKISDDDIYINNILNDPSSSGQKFLVYGNKKNNDGEIEGILIALDFSTLYVRKCSYSDYETWSPRSSTQKDMSQFCIMGESITYQRRKRNSKCVNGENFVTSLNKKICECTEDDYQCDIGFQRNEPGDPCTPIEKKTQDEMYKPPENCKGYYTISKGYRIIPGNKCSGLDKYKPIKIQCPYNKFAYFFKIIIILGIIGVVVYGVYYINTYTNIEFKEIWDVIVSLIPNIDLSFGGDKRSYLSTDDYDDDKDYGFDQEQNVKKKKKKSGKKKTMKSGEVPIDTQTNLSNNISVL